MKKIEPMLATLVDKPFSDKNWFYEIKFDGERAITFFKKDRISIKSRNQNEIAYKYPEIINDLPKSLRCQSAVLDGEICVLDEKGISRFQLLQNRIGLQSKLEIVNKMKETPVIYFIFDILELNSKNVEDMMLSERKEFLQKIFKTSPHVKLTEYIEEKGEVFFEAARRKGLEGIIAKKKSSKYLEGVRGKDWLKIKATLEQEAVIGGYTEGTGARAKTFGAILLGVYEKGKLVFVGHSGTGFDELKLKELYQKFQKLRTDQSPFSKSPKTNQRAYWLKPRLVAQIKFAEWTRDNIMRVPVFLGLRDDKKPQEVKREK